MRRKTSKRWLACCKKPKQVMNLPAFGILLLALATVRLPHLLSPPGCTQQSVEHLQLTEAKAHAYLAIQFARLHGCFWTAWTCRASFGLAHDSPELYYNPLRGKCHYEIEQLQRNYLTTISSSRLWIERRVDGEVYTTHVTLMCDFGQYCSGTRECTRACTREKIIHCENRFASWSKTFERRGWRAGYDSPVRPL